jgi:hypothetical protein
MAPDVPARSSTISNPAAHAGIEDQMCEEGSSSPASTVVKPPQEICCWKPRAEQGIGELNVKRAVEEKTGSYHAGCVI